jgi:quercetin dioxygenase-like cupin family protein
MMRRTASGRSIVMPLERANEHPVHDLGGNTITSFAAPARGSAEVALYRAEVPPGGGLPRHRHDHLDVFTVERGGGEFWIGEERFPVTPGDSVVVPIGEWHHLVAGPEAAAIAVAMLGGTKLVREDGSESVPPWVG